MFLRKSKDFPDRNQTPSDVRGARWLFIHIPKTAGSTFRTMLTDSLGDQYYPNYSDLELNRGLYVQPNDFLKLYNSEGSALPEKSVVSGHFRGVIHDQLKSKRKRAVFLRDPMARAISMIGHAQRFGFLRVYRSPEEVLADTKFLEARVRESQTRIVAPVHKTELDVNYEFKVDAAMVDLALEELRSYDFVGFVEDIQTSVSRFQKLAGISLSQSVSHRNPGPQQKLTNHQLDHIRSLVEFDIQLYEGARRLCFKAHDSIQQ